MNIILLGAPGSGKGTQAEHIVKDFSVTHISTGDIFRKNIKENTPLGLKAKEFINQGKLVPDELVVDIVASRLQESDCLNGFMLDGFPRTVFQAEELDKIAKIDAVVNLDIDTNLLISRLSGRRVCDLCGKSNHKDQIPSDCNCSCTGTYIQREDDKEETVKNRLNVYEMQTKPLIQYYKNQNKLINIQAGRQIPEVYKDILKALKSL